MTYSHYVRACEILRAAVTALDDYTDADDSGGNWAMHLQAFCSNTLHVAPFGCTHEDALAQVAEIDALRYPRLALVAQEASDLLSVMEAVRALR